MARIAFLIPRTGTRNAINGIGSGSTSQVNNEFLLDDDNKELYVGTGESNPYEGSNSRPVTYNINKLTSAASVTVNSEIPIADSGETRKTTLNSIVSLVSATAGDTKTVIVEAGDDLSYAGALHSKVLATGGLTQDIVNPPSKQLRLQIANAGVTAAKLSTDAVIESKIADEAVTLSKLASIAYGTNELSTTSSARLWTGKKIMEYINSKVMVSINAWWDYHVENIAQAQVIQSTLYNSRTCYHFVAGGTSVEWAGGTYRKPYPGMRILVGNKLSAGEVIALGKAYVCEVVSVDSEGQILEWLTTECSPEVLYYTYGTISGPVDADIVNGLYDDDATSHLEVDSADNRMVFYGNGGMMSINIEVASLTPGDGIDIVAGEISFKPKVAGGLLKEASGVSIKVNPTSPGLSINGDGLNVVAKNASLNIDGDGVEVQLAGSGGIGLTGTGLAITQVIGGTI